MNRMSGAPDLIGRRFERIVVVRYAGTNRHRQGLVEVECDCGNRIVTLATRVRNGNTRSCGCLQAETRRANGQITMQRHPKLPQRWAQTRRKAYANLERDERRRQARQLPKGSGAAMLLDDANRAEEHWSLAERQAVTRHQRMVAREGLRLAHQMQDLAGSLVRLAYDSLPAKPA